VIAGSDYRVIAWSDWRCRNWHECRTGLSSGDTWKLTRRGRVLLAT